MKRSLLGFTLIEMLVVVAIIGILSSVLYANFRESSAYTRDVERQANLRAVQAALEAYKKDHGRYPKGCNDPNNILGFNAAAQGWSGQHDSDVHCLFDANADFNADFDTSKNFKYDNEYIIGLVPKYIKALPVDRKLKGDNSGYRYTSNEEGTVYKFMAYRTVETEDVSYDHELKPCNVSGKSGGGVADQVTCTADTPPSIGSETECDAAMCDSVNTSSNNTPNRCMWWNNSQNGIFKSSYAVWGGYHFRAGAATQDRHVEWDTEAIVCKM